MVDDLERENRQERRNREAKRTWLDLAPASALVLLVLAILVAGAWLNVDDTESREPERATERRPTAPPRAPTPERRQPSSRAETVPPPSREASPAPATPAIAAETTRPEPASPTPRVEAREPSSLSERAARDRARLAAAGGVWTLQLAASCETETVSRLVASVAPTEPLFVVPWSGGGAGCYRLCWGSWPDRAAAAAASPPAPLRLGEPPFPRRAAEVVR